MLPLYHALTKMAARLAPNFLGAGIFLLWEAVGIQPAWAQLFDQLRDPSVPGTGTAPGVTVLSRLRPDYDYPGVDVGPFRVRPELVLSTGYDDNVLGTSRGKGSTLQQTQISLAAGTIWSRSSLVAVLQANDYRFLDLPAESYTNWNASVGWTHEIERDTVAVNYYHQNLNQTPQDLNVGQLDNPIAYRIDTVDVSYNKVINRASLQPAVQVSNYDFDSGSTNGQPYLQGYRNRIVVTPQLSAAYELSPQRNVVAVVRNASALYRTVEPGTGVRNYNDTAALAGLDYQLAGPYRFRILAGYETRSFTSRRFKTINAPVAEATFVWTPSGLTTLTALLSRHVADSADEATASLTETAGHLSIDHELARNVLLHGESGIEVAKYGQGGGSQTLYTFGVSATWLLNRHARLGASYAFTQRKSRINGLFGGSGTIGLLGQSVGANYIDNRFLLQMRFGL